MLIINAKEDIPATIVGTLASIISKSNEFKKKTYILSLARTIDKTSKVSLRISGYDTDVDLREILKEIVTSAGGEGGSKMASRQVSLSVNDGPIELDYFVQPFIDHTVSGILAALEGTGEIKSVDISIEGDAVSVNLNDAAVSLNPFVTRIIRNTIVGMVSSLKGVGQINRLKIGITR